MRYPLAALVAILFSRAALANDRAAETAAGGIVLRSEPRIEMRKERLRISQLKPDSFRVVVEYEFVNDTKEEVTTEIAFPVPEYGYFYSDVGGPRDLGTFHAWVNDAPINVQREVRALLKDGKDYAPLLSRHHIDVASFGHFEPDAEGSDFDPLSDAALAKLSRLGLIKLDQEQLPWPKWNAAITWHWRQAFPAGKTVRIRHEYTPSPGIQVCGLDLRAAAAPPRFCFSPSMWSKLQTVRGEQCVTDQWVKYILTTANTWKTPIADFELIVETILGKSAAFCWGGPIEQVDAQTWRAAVKDFVPKEELTVFFY